jgi:DNA-directed RNA polymerase III subunit RPC1
VGNLKLIQERYKGSSSKREDLIRDFHANFEEAIKFNKDIKQLLSKAQDDLNPLRVLQIFQNVTDEDCELFDMSAEVGRPESLILTHILVPPGNHSRYVYIV